MRLCRECKEEYIVPIREKLCTKCKYKKVRLSGVDHRLSFCPHCGCMTKTLTPESQGTAYPLCGKCHEKKEGKG